ncbi:hypothetical protein KN400_3429 [Geobacter sulfurreducens KN400]|nr:hypothetical protein KN400_3429 [Geobacter sulfurreducens KN400]
MMQLAAMDGAMRCFRREGCTSHSVTGGGAATDGSRREDRFHEGESALRPGVR